MESSNSQENSKQRILQNIHRNSLFSVLAKHPFICVFAICLFLFPFGLCEQPNLNIGSMIYAAVICILAAGAVVALGRFSTNLKQNFAIFGIAFLYIISSIYLIFQNGYSTSLIYFLSVIGLGIVAIALKLTDRLSTRTFVALMIAAGIMLRFTYILYTDSLSRQHDVGWFNWIWGHSNYIEYWYNNGLKLPDFDVRTIWQYYHPPLHHWLMAILLRALTTLGIEYDVACQAIQILPMLYSSLIMVVCYKIFRQLKLNGTPLIVAMALICFHPTFVIMAGSYNNDILSVLFILLAVLWAFRWYKSHTIKNIIVLSLCIGLGMMTKLSVWMVAPSVAFLFLFAFLNDTKKWKSYIIQFVVFAVICFPLALWWQTRNFLAFGVPITYIPNLGPQDPTYSGNMSILKRLFDFGNGQLDYVYDAYVNYGATYNEYNPTIGLFKTAMFDEGENQISTIHFPQLEITGRVLFWVSVVLFLLCFVAFLYVMVSKKSNLKFTTRVFYLILFAIFIGSYYLFCFQYPHTCTMNIRYCVPLIVMCAFGLGLLLQSLKSTRWHKILKYSAYTLTILFVAATSVVYTQVGVIA